MVNNLTIPRHAFDVVRSRQGFKIARRNRDLLARNRLILRPEMKGAQKIDECAGVAYLVGHVGT